MMLTPPVQQSFQLAKSFGQNNGPVNSMDYNDTGDLLVTASDDDSINLYDCKAGRYQKDALEYFTVNSIYSARIRVKLQRTHKEPERYGLKAVLALGTYYKKNDTLWIWTLHVTNRVLLRNHFPPCLIAGICRRCIVKSTELPWSDSHMGEKLYCTHRWKKMVQFYVFSLSIIRHCCSFVEKSLHVWYGHTKIITRTFA